MKHLTLALAALALAGAAALQPPPAAADHIVDQTVTCEKWNKDKEWRCLFKAANGGPTAAVLAKQNVQESVAFEVAEFHSICGLPSNQIDASSHVLEGGAEKTLNVLCPGGGITCREMFIANCKVNGASRNCPEVLSVVGKTYKGGNQ